ncbi:TPA: hypothetical protein ACGPI4_005411 [Bacillus paranthracis]
MSCKIVFNQKQIQYIADVVMEFVPKYGIEAFKAPDDEGGEENDVSQSELSKRKSS